MKTCREKCKYTSASAGLFLAKEENECAETFPEDRPFYESHEPGLFACYVNDKQYIEYDTNLAVDKCDKNHPYWGQKPKFDAAYPDNKKYCLKECNEDFGFLITPNMECVKDCGSNFYFVENSDDSKIL